jgi:hypothetical protein
MSEAITSHNGRVIDWAENASMVLPRALNEYGDWLKDVIKSGRQLEGSYMPGFAAKPMADVNFYDKVKTGQSPFTIGVGKKEWNTIEKHFGNPADLKSWLFRYPTTGSPSIVNFVQAEAESGIFVNPVLELLMNIDTDDDKIYTSIYSKKLDQEAISSLEKEIAGLSGDSTRLPIAKRELFNIKRHMGRMEKELSRRSITQAQQYNHLVRTFERSNATTAEGILAEMQGAYTQFAGKEYNILQTVAASRLPVVPLVGNELGMFDTESGRLITKRFQGTTNAAIFGVSKSHARALKSIASRAGMTASEEIVRAAAGFEDPVIEALRTQGLIGQYTNVMTNLTDLYGSMRRNPEARWGLLTSCRLDGETMGDASKRFNTDIELLRTMTDLREDVIKQVKGNDQQKLGTDRQMVNKLSKIGTSEKLAEGGEPWLEELAGQFGPNAEKMIEAMNRVNRVLYAHTGGAGVRDKLFGRPLYNELGERMFMKDFTELSAGSIMAKKVEEQASKSKLKLPREVAIGLGVLGLVKFFSPNQMKVLGEMPGQGGELWDYRSGKSELPFFTPVDVPQYTWESDARVSGIGLSDRFNKIAASIIPKIRRGYGDHSNARTASNVTYDNRRRLSSRFDSKSVWQDVNRF